MKLPKNQEPLEPKAPETLQKLKWLRLYGWRHKWYVLIGIVLIGITFLNFGVLKRLAGFTSFHNHLSTEESVPKKKKFLTTHETPNEILNILGDYPSPDDRRREAYALFIDRWLQEPWVGTVCRTPERTEDQEGWSFRLMTYSKSGKGSSLNIVDTKQDASSLREGMQIRVTGRITGDLILGLSLKEATFEVVQLSTEESIPQKKIFLTTHERPDQIIEVLDQYSGSDRKKKASDLYIGRWLQEPWIGIVSRNPEKFEDGDEWWFSFETQIPKSQGICVNAALTKQDAASLRKGMKIRVIGQIAGDLIVGLSLKEASFEIISPTNSEIKTKRVK